VDLLVGVRIGRNDEGRGLDTEQVIFAHQPQNALAVHHHAAPHFALPAMGRSTNR